jgi:hypothetical protein
VVPARQKRTKAFAQFFSRAVLVLATFTLMSGGTFLCFLALTFDQETVTLCDPCQPAKFPPVQDPFTMEMANQNTLNATIKRIFHPFVIQFSGGIFSALFFFLASLGII